MKTSVALHQIVADLDFRAEQTDVAT